MKKLFIIALLATSAFAQDVDAGVPAGAIALPEATLTPPQSQAVVKASAKDGFRIESSDGNWGLQIGGLFWASFNETIYNGTSSPHFAIPGARLMVRANIFRPWISFFFQPEFAVTPRVLDMEVAIQPWDELGLKVGQFVPAYSRSFLTPVPKLEFQGFSQANNIFRPDRQAGAMLFGAFFGGRLEYFAGVFDGVGINKTNNDNPHMMWNARIAGTLFGTPPTAKQHVKYDETAHLAGNLPPTLQIGVDGYINRVGTAPVEIETQALSADLSFTWGRFFAQTEGYLRRLVAVGQLVPDLLQSGADFQAGFFILPSVLELAGRVSWAHFDSTPGAWLIQGDAQLGYYVAGNHLKALLRYSLTDSPAAYAGFAPGITHAVLLQLQVWL